MIITDDRLSHLAHLIQDRLYQDDLIEYEDDGKALLAIKRALIDYFKVEEESDRIAREKVSHLKRGVSEGSREWEILYRKYLEEELQKHRR